MTIILMDLLLIITYRIQKEQILLVILNNIVSIIQPFHKKIKSFQKKQL